MDILKIRAITLFMVAFLNLGLALVLWYGARKDKSRVWLGVTALSSSFYALFCGATYFFWGGNLFISLIWYKTTWFGILMIPAFLIFIYYFTSNTKNLALKAIIFYLVAFFIIYLVFTTNFFVKSVHLRGFNVSSINGELDFIGRIYIFLCILIALGNLLKDYFKTTGFKKLQLQYFISGIVIYTTTGIITTSLIPFFIKESPYYDFTAYASLVWLGLTTYAIFKYKLLDIRIIATELLTFAIWVTLLINIFSSNGIQEVLINSVVFIAVIVAGVLLIRSVMKEVQQREEIAQMAEDVRRAYVIEKRAKEEIEKIDKFKDQFLMTTQHNLRTPLTSMIGYSDLLLSGTFGKQNKKTTEVIKRFQLLTQGMVKMINDFLNMAQFQLGKDVVSLKSGVEIVPILEDIIQELQFKAETRGIYLKFEKPSENFKIVADREKLKAALFNIVDNAVKYTEKGGVTVKISLDQQGLPKADSQFLISSQKENSEKILNLKSEIINPPQSKPSVLIEVRDTGIGIPPDKIKTLFETQFERTEEAKRASPVGTGIGLYLAGQIIKAHKGRVWAESEGQGNGSTFYVELPIG